LAHILPLRFFFSATDSFASGGGGSAGGGPNCALDAQDTTADTSHGASGVNAGASGVNAGASGVNAGTSGVNVSLDADSARDEIPRGGSRRGRSAQGADIEGGAGDTEVCSGI